ncbi:hypothetical protein TYRP_012790 [Tyrophagus putrescentiae]|nr:hypothetical protein TYRP_023044 [Tyrophagus putrescentiae]KAH9407240.1 hypothetical protein TYRP_012790 [Tyrophagus putrescentiae]
MPHRLVRTVLVEKPSSFAASPNCSRLFGSMTTRYARPVSLSVRPRQSARNWSMIFRPQRPPAHEAGRPG